MTVVSTLILAGKVYLLAGVGFAIWFAARGAGRLDPGATGSTLGFRLLLIPGAVVLWPYLAARILAATRSDAQ